MAYDAALAILAHPTRRAVVERLASGPKSASELASGFPVSRPAVSQHLRALREAGMVSVAKQGTRRIYALRPEALGQLREYLDRMWSEVLASLEEPGHGQ